MDLCSHRLAGWDPAGHGRTTAAELTDPLATAVRTRGSLTEAIIRGHRPARPGFP